MNEWPSCPAWEDTLVVCWPHFIYSNIVFGIVVCAKVDMNHFQKGTNQF